jgi:hypothetical protein
MNYRLALAVLYVLLMAAVAAVLVYRLNPAVITAIPIPFVTLATVTLARRSVRRHGDRGSSGDEHGNV